MRNTLDFTVKTAEMAPIRSWAPQKKKKKMLLKKDLGSTILVRANVFRCAKVDDANVIVLRKKDVLWLKICTTYKSRYAQPLHNKYTSPTHTQQKTLVARRIESTQICYLDV
jgi:hypothetical protein